MSHKTREELSRMRPLSPAQSLRLRKALAVLSAEAAETLINAIPYAEARQLCHDFGIKQIKGNCRKVLARRVRRLRLVDTTGRLEQLVGEVTNA